MINIQQSIISREEDFLWPNTPARLEAVASMRKKLIATIEAFDPESLEDYEQMDTEDLIEIANMLIRLY